MGGSPKCEALGNPSAERRRAAEGVPSAKHWGTRSDIHHCDAAPRHRFLDTAQIRVRISLKHFPSEPYAHRPVPHLSPCAEPPTSALIPLAFFRRARPQPYLTRGACPADSSDRSSSTSLPLHLFLFDTRGSEPLCSRSSRSYFDLNTRVNTFP